MHPTDDISLVVMLGINIYFHLWFVQSNPLFRAVFLKKQDGHLFVTTILFVIPVVNL